MTISKLRSVVIVPCAHEIETSRSPFWDTYLLRARKGHCRHFRPCLPSLPPCSSGRAGASATVAAVPGTNLTAARRPPRHILFLRAVPCRSTIHICGSSLPVMCRVDVADKRLCTACSLEAPCPYCGFNARLGQRPGNKREAFDLAPGLHRILSLGTSSIDRPKPQGRSRVSNGSRLFLDENVDGRSREARRFRDVLSDLVAHMGGEPTSAEVLIAQRAATLAVWCEAREAEMVSGQEIDIGQFTTATNTLRRLIADIGMERRARDVTPTLARYLEQKAAQG